MRATRAMTGPCGTLNHATDGIGLAYAQDQVVRRGYDDEVFDSVRALLYGPARFAYGFVRHPLRRAMEAVGVSGVRFGTCRLFRSPDR